MEKVAHVSRGKPRRTLPVVPEGPALGRPPEAQTIDNSDLDDLAELLKLRPWQRDRLGYWFDHIPYNHE